MPDSRIRSRIRPSLPAILLATSAAVVPAPAAAQSAAQSAARSAAQPETGHPKADPLDASAAVPPVRVRSSFAGYHGLADEKVGSWREANDTVGQIGGWKVYAQEAAQPDGRTPPDASAQPAGAGSAGGNGAARRVDDGGQR
jgi:hypothetical protein